MSERKPIPDGEAFEKAVEQFCEEAEVGRPAKDADPREINSFASWFAAWWRDREQPA